MPEQPADSIESDSTDKVTYVLSHDLSDSVVESWLRVLSESDEDVIVSPHVPEGTVYVFSMPPVVWDDGERSEVDWGNVGETPDWRKHVGRITGLDSPSS